MNNNKNLTITFGTIGSVESFINMLEKALSIINNYVDANKSSTITMKKYQPAIRISDIKNILFSEKKMDPIQSTLFIVTHKETIPATPLCYYSIPQLEVFSKWIMSTLLSEKQKLNLMKN